MKIDDLAAVANQQAETAKVRSALIDELRADPEWETALLTCGVAVAPLTIAEEAGIAQVGERVDRVRGAQVLRAAASRIEERTGVKIPHPEALLAYYAHGIPQPLPK